MSGFLKIIYYPCFSGYVGDEVVLSQREELKHDLAKLEKLDKYQDALRKRRLAEEPPREEAMAVKEERVSKSETKLEVKTVDINEKKDDVENTCKDESDEPEGVIVNRKHDKSNSVADGKHVVTIENDPCVYTLERAFDEMIIGTDITDTERSKSDAKNVLEQNEYKENLDKISKDTGQNDVKAHQAIKEIDIDPIEMEAITGKKVNSKEQRSEPRAMSQNVKSGPNLGESKTDYLMRLLEKRKSLLAKMADIQPPAEGHDNVQGVNKLLKSNSDSAPVHSIQTSAIVSNESSGSEVQAKSLNEVDNIDKVTVLDRTKVSDVKVELKSAAAGNQMHIHSISKHDKGKEKFTKRTLLAEKKKSSIEVEKQIVSTLQLICKTIQAWITVESAEYLNKKETKKSDPGRTEFERQYKALERKIDQQERDLDNMLGKKNGVFCVLRICS